MANTNRLGELLVREKLISLSQLRTAQEEQQKGGGNLGYTLAKLGYISDDEITNFLSQQYRVPTIDLADYEIDAEIVKLVSKEQCEKHRVVPVSRTGNALIVAMADPTNLHAIDDLKFLTSYNIEPVIASETAILATIEKYYNAGPSYDEVMAGFDEQEIDFTGEEEDLNLLELEKASEDAPVVRLVNMILLNAIKKGASDIHIEPYEKKLRVRLRVDGVLLEEMTPPLKLKNAIVSRLKIMSQLDIAERRLPQDGRIKLKLGKGREMDFRVSVLPTIWGEKIVMRLLDKGNLQVDMTKLGFDGGPLKDFMWAIGQPWGMVLVTGPTGSGKTTTLYSALSELNKPGTNVSTAEDPVEYNLMGINQVQMHDEIGLNFAMALRQAPVGVGNLGQDQVDDVVGDVLVAPRYPHLAAAQAVAGAQRIVAFRTWAVRLGAGGDLRQAGAGLGLRQAHGAEPAPFDLRPREGVDLGGRAEARDQPRVGGGQHRIGDGREVGGGELGEGGGRHRLGQAETAQVLGEAGGEQAELGVLSQRLADLGQHVDAGLVQIRLDLVGLLVGRQEGVLRQPFGEVEDGIEQVAAVLAGVGLQPVVEQEIEVAARDQGRGHQLR